MTPERLAEVHPNHDLPRPTMTSSHDDMMPLTVASDAVNHKSSPLLALVSPSASGSRSRLN